MEISLKGRGPFTVFAPNAEALEAAKREVHDYTSRIFSGERTILVGSEAPCLSLSPSLALPLSLFLSRPLTLPLSLFLSRSLTLPLSVSRSSSLARPLPPAI